MELLIKNVWGWKIPPLQYASRTDPNTLPEIVCLDSILIPIKHYLYLVVASISVQYNCWPSREGVNNYWTTRGWVS